MKRIIKFIFLVWGAVLAGCSEDTVIPSDNTPGKVIEKTVAVVLPFEGGLDIHWQRSLSMFSLNLERAFKSQDTAIKLRFELYDESAEDLQKLSRELGARQDIYAVIGGLYSANSAILTSNLTRVGKSFFTLATSEELVRAYASTGYLWAMTETDITQCEVLLAKVVNYGGESVALIARDDDLYGKTFIDWFSFQARELGLESKGVFSYKDGNLGERSMQAMLSGAEYVICVPSEIDDIMEIMESYDRLPTAEEGISPRLLFSDTGYGKDVISICGEKAEGIEGVAFGADPESGFDISYRTYFGENPTTGEAQLYDAAMLIGYAAWLGHLNGELNLTEALRKIVSGSDINMGSWTGEDMSLVIDALARGDSPCVRGASGALRFDTKIFTNVLTTTYYNYKLYNGKYIILDYNTSDGSNRTDATLAGWNWKASQMQEFEETAGLAYPPLEGNWAVLIATSQGWNNYRHQADVLAIYKELKKAGYPDERIILIAEDDLAYNPSNPEPGIIRVVPGGENVYDEVEIDYNLSNLEPTDFVDILTGKSSSRLPVVLGSGPGDNVFVFWSGHGEPGWLKWNDLPGGMNSEMLAGAFVEMRETGHYRKLLMMVEACYSGGVINDCRNFPGMLFITAANGEETSKADIFSGEMKVWMSNRFTSTFLQQIRENCSVSMRDLYYRLFINTVGSHVMVYNAENFGNLFSSDMEEFIIFR